MIVIHGTYGSSSLWENSPLSLRLRGEDRIPAARTVVRSPSTERARTDSGLRIPDHGTRCRRSAAPGIPARAARHIPSRGEIAGLLAIVGRDLRDCRAQGLSPEWQLSIAYNANLQAPTGWAAFAALTPRSQPCCEGVF